MGINGDSLYVSDLFFFKFNAFIRSDYPQIQCFKDVISFVQNNVTLKKKNSHCHSVPNFLPVQMFVKSL